MASSQGWYTCPKCSETAFDATSYSTGEFYGFCVYCGHFHERTFKNEDYPEKGFKTNEGGGFGVVTKTNGLCERSYSVKDGEIPEITDDVIFATAVIDGKLTVLKENKEEDY